MDADSDHIELYMINTTNNKAMHAPVYIQILRTLPRPCHVYKIIKTHLCNVPFFLPTVNAKILAGKKFGDFV